MPRLPHTRTGKTSPNRSRKLKLNRGESISMQRNGVTACSWQDKKKVNFLTTNCQPTGDDTALRREKDGTQEVLNTPPCVVAYNKFMGGGSCVTLNRCVYCASRNQRHRSTWGCVLCDVTLCVSCFEPFHTRWRNLRRINMARARISNLVTEQENGVFHYFVPKIVDGKTLI